MNYLKCYTLARFAHWDEKIVKEKHENKEKQGKTSEFYSELLWNMTLLLHRRKDWRILDFLRARW